MKAETKENFMQDAKITDKALIERLNQIVCITSWICKKYGKDTPVFYIHTRLTTIKIIEHVYLNNIELDRLIVSYCDELGGNGCATEEMLRDVDDADWGELEDMPNYRQPQKDYTVSDFAKVATADIKERLLYRSSGLSELPENLSMFKDVIHHQPRRPAVLGSINN